jgi:hypothetical protein
MMYKWDTETALEMIERERVTLLSAAPAMGMQLRVDTCYGHRRIWCRQQLPG